MYATLSLTAADARINISSYHYCSLMQWDVYVCLRKICNKENSGIAGAQARISKLVIDVELPGGQVYPYKLIWVAANPHDEPTITVGDVTADSYFQNTDRAAQAGP